jgi:hypothetical protein
MILYRTGHKHISFSNWYGFECIDIWVLISEVKKIVHRFWLGKGLPLIGKQMVSTLAMILTRNNFAWDNQLFHPVASTGNWFASLGAFSTLATPVSVYRVTSHLYSSWSSFNNSWNWNVGMFPSSDNSWPHNLTPFLNTPSGWPSPGGRYLLQKEYRSKLWFS